MLPTTSLHSRLTSRIQAEITMATPGWLLENITRIHCLNWDTVQSERRVCEPLSAYVNCNCANIREYRVTLHRNVW